MRYVLLGYHDPAAWNLTPDQVQEHLAGLSRLARELEAQGALIGGTMLTPAEATVRVARGEPVVTDGPFAETKEQLLGLVTLECGGRDEAIAIARRFAALPHMHGALEVHAIDAVRSSPNWPPR